MTEQEKNNPLLDKRSSRRTFIKNSGLTVGGVVLGGALGSLLGKDSSEVVTQGQVEGQQYEAQQYDHALEYFQKRADFILLGQITERIFPEDENGPGAIGLGVPYYIDHQLAGKWGINAKDYRMGPFFEGEKVQGYQTQLKYHQIFDLGLVAIESYSQETFNESFVKLEGEQQDEVITALENDQVNIPGIKSSFFFEILLKATMEGAYSDPLYGGNKDMQGWKMKEYPGVQMSYSADQVASQKFIEIPPVSLHDRQS
ncbi:gluconate 2-dehydrogenase subunit 3 family protein [Psychrobacillus sp. NPDC096426]|uniref:gluconate 2-dehydrogenase subunit 3 family protein n=1 Tax=Psychrobacillus sp. NPDC096426 TaxID=3364491 RepID=UPI0038188999